MDGGLAVFLTIAVLMVVSMGGIITFLVYKIAQNRKEQKQAVGSKSAASQSETMGITVEETNLEKPLRAGIHGSPKRVVEGDRRNKHLIPSQIKEIASRGDVREVIRTVEQVNYGSMTSKYDIKRTQDTAESETDCDSTKDTRSSILGSADANTSTPVGFNDTPRHLRKHGHEKGGGKSKGGGVPRNKQNYERGEGPGHNIKDQADLSTGTDSGSMTGPFLEEKTMEISEARIKTVDVDYSNRMSRSFEGYLNRDEKLAKKLERIRESSDSPPESATSQAKLEDITVPLKKSDKKKKRKIGSNAGDNSFNSSEDNSGAQSTEIPQHYCEYSTTVSPDLSGPVGAAYSPDLPNSPGVPKLEANNSLNQTKDSSGYYSMRLADKSSTIAFAAVTDASSMHIPPESSSVELNNSQENQLGYRTPSYTKSIPADSPESSNIDMSHIIPYNPVKEIPMPKQMSTPNTQTHIELVVENEEKLSGKVEKLEMKAD